MPFQRRFALVYGDTVFIPGIAETLYSMADMESFVKKLQAEFKLPAVNRSRIVLMGLAQVAPAQVQGMMASPPDNHSPPNIHPK
jgi:hypothetical protein